jgi:Tol biopolymer transport system component
MADSRHIAAVGPPTSLDPPANLDVLSFPCSAGIYRLDSQTGAVSLMFDVPNYHVGQGMDFSPDRRRIAYLRSPRVGRLCRVLGSTELVVAKVNGSDARVVARERRGWSLDHPSWSPDSRRLVFMRFGNNNKLQVMTVRRDGSQLRNISKGCKSCAGWFPQWISAR